MSGEHKLKDSDEIIRTVESSNNKELLFFSNKCRVYKARVSDFGDSKASVLGDYVASELAMEPGETAIYMAVTQDYSGYMLFFFENGKAAKVEMSSYRTVMNRKKLINAYSDKSPLAGVTQLQEDRELVVQSSSGRLLLFNTGSVTPKTSKATIGVSVMSLKKGQRVIRLRDYTQGEFAKPYRYKTKNLPAAGALPSAEDSGEQLALNN